MTDPRASYSTSFSSAFDADFDAPTPEPGPPSGSTPRQILTAMLRAALPEDVDVQPYAHNMTGPERSTVMVRVDRARNAPAGLGMRDYDFALVCIAPKTTWGPADDELDALLEDVLFALSSNSIPNAVVFTEAVRATYGEPDASNPAYEVTLSITVQTT